MNSWPTTVGSLDRERLTAQFGQRKLAFVKVTVLCFFVNANYYVISSVITETGKELSVLIVTETDWNWQTFATWYSFYKNLPDAVVRIVAQRNGSTPFVYFQWAKRLNVSCIKKSPFNDSETLNWLDAGVVCQEKNLLSNNVLIVRPLTMAIDILQPKILESFCQTDQWIDEDMWFLRDPDFKSLLNKAALEENPPKLTSVNLCFEAKNTQDLASFVSYKKGCGRWIDTSKGCPFSSAAGLASTEMTVNEYRIIELWKKMVPLYKAVV